MAQRSTPQANIPALRIRQWLPQWGEYRFDPEEHQSKPPPDFFLCSMTAEHLKALTGVYHRSTKDGVARAQDQNIQRGHEEERSDKIRDFIKAGYPWCELGPSKRKLSEAQEDRKPGWIPTAILVNILTPNAERNKIKIRNSDLVTVEDQNGSVSLKLPKGFTGGTWKPESLYPLEVIDGQHRLWAFEKSSFGDNFQLPVVAFHGLDHGWQAYLFWSVNITPKKINRSLAFDLYPLLRQQTWLDRFAGHSIYRETRCQELVEALWSHPDSPWFQRLNMLGEKREFREYKGQVVSQAAFIRSLLASFVKQWNENNETLGGLFGASSQKHVTFLPWNRAMQAAFLIFAANALKSEVSACTKTWAKNLRSFDNDELFSKDDPAFYGEYSLFTTDQGIRGFLFVVNDLCYIRANELKMQDWRWDSVYEDPKAAKLAATEEGAVSAALKTLPKQKLLSEFLTLIARGLAKYDWRSSSTPNLTPTEQREKLVFRGSSGYKELRRQLLEHLSSESSNVGSAADDVLTLLSYK